jgi:hypothetical protein
LTCIVSIGEDIAPSETNLLNSVKMRKWHNFVKMSASTRSDKSYLIGNEECDLIKYLTLNTMEWNNKIGDI